MKSDNVIVGKSFAFAIKVVKAHRYLTKEKSEYVLSKQLLRSGTSIGANIEEAVGGQSQADFAAKLAVVYKEARESSYWIRLLRETNYLNEKAAASLLNDIEEIQKIIGSIQIAIKRKNS
jgi:four helix bundle protein